MKYTAIYLESWVIGSNRHLLVKMRQIEKSGDETIADMLEREGIKDDIQFLFVGHPPLVGDEEDTESPCVMRGGSWCTEPLGLRGAARTGLLPPTRDDLWGFRLAMD